MDKIMDYQTALSKTTTICAGSEHCEFDISQKLYRWKVSETDIKKITTYLKQNNYINHHRFAQAFVRDKFKFNRWGSRKIEYELKSRRIESSLIQEALMQILDESSYNQLKTILQEKLNQIKNKTPLLQKASLIRHAVSKGYEQNMIYSIVNNLISIDFED